MCMLRSFLIVGLGSFVGGGCRFWLSKAIQNAVTYSFPFGTLIVNVAGCMLIGFLYGIFDRGGLMNVDLRLFLTVGFCGGFTTFSTFMNENFMLIRDNNFYYLAFYLALSVVGGFIALFLGNQMTKLF